MSVGTELHELEERMEQQGPFFLVSLTMAVLAVLVACVSVLTHRAHTQVIIIQSQESDGWAHYQSKSTRRQTAEVFSEMLSVVAPKDPAAAEALRRKFEGEVERLQADGKKIEEENKALNEKFEQQEMRANRFDLGEAILEAALVVTFVTLLTKKRMFWFTGLAVALLGLATSLSPFWPGE